MKIPLQDKIAELERRIVALEGKAKPSTAPTATKTTVTTTTLTPEQEGHWATTWKHFDAAFESFGKMFR